LDALRGLAAMTVVNSHALDSLIDGHSLDEYTPLYLFRAAHESVIFFFILSGYVLTTQIQQQNSFDYKKFIIQRLWRIYVPYFFVMLLTFLLFLFFHGNLADGRPVWSEPLSFKIILNHLLLVTNFNTNSYNPVIWSLVHELRISLLFPIILFILPKDFKKLILIALLISVLAAICIVNGLNPSLGYNNSYLYTLHYISLFILGSIIFNNIEILSVLYNRFSGKKKLALLIIALMLFNYSRMIFLIPHKFKLIKLSLFNEFVADWFTAASACFFIIIAIELKKEKSWLITRIPLFLGKISYSLYLLHLPIIIVFFILFPTFNRPLLMLICVVTGVIVAYFTNKYIEKPAAIIGMRRKAITNIIP